MSGKMCRACVMGFKDCDCLPALSAVPDDGLGSNRKGDLPTEPEAAFRAVCMNRGGDVHPLAAACLVPGCTAEMGVACRNPNKEER